MRKAVEAGLSRRPFVTPAGDVLPDLKSVKMGSPSGAHEVPPAWVYKRRNGALEMVFQFYWNFTKDDLICKVVEAGQYPENYQGASVQFNANESVRVEGGAAVLFHHGRVTLRHGISRDRLLEAMHAVCPRATDLASIHSTESWPLRIGSSDDLPKLIDSIFLYAYCLEQGKRHLSGLPLLDDLTDLGP